ncbi:ABC transporter substrate-binding protein [Propionibacterium freudenreichii]|uniref:ABC transporter substrate-binding protein n=1 Tax=Propionibacterium freudenreichii TaxID=1744 RepID=UPI002549F5A7|nr:ABC transporter substrate-binding protein [Propionibacterium freudenreichii]MDK9322417.1 ABC transporter substrate-binding protein [Propionibacterium freudenreichii]MDK9324801.1 ABC transporter substrate-binding protein [Propionibacterium freudenreichii]
MKRRTLLGTLGIMGLSVPLAACSSKSSGSGSSGTGKKVKIGITQIVTHSSLDAAREGFKKAITDAGFNASFDEQNAQGDQGTAASIATKLASENLDLVLAIATPAAQAAAQAITNVPIVFTAVTDPKSADLVASNDAPGGNVTGTSDMNPVADQIGLIKQIKPDATSVGILYSSGEVNSQVQVNLAKEAAAKDGLSVQEKTITTTGELQQAAQALNVDSIYIPTDNNVVSGLSTVIQVCEDRKIPLISAEGDSVRNGAVITYGIDYTELGRQTGEMAVKILNGDAKPATMPVETQKNLKLYVNEKAASLMGVTIPDDLVSKAEKVG